LLGQELWQIGLFQDREANLESLRELQEKQSIRYEMLLPQTTGRQHRAVEFVSTLLLIVSANETLLTSTIMTNDTGKNRQTTGSN
jgi:hypothetical protein